MGFSGGTRGRRAAAGDAAWRASSGLARRKVLVRRARVQSLPWSGMRRLPAIALLCTFVAGMTACSAPGPGTAVTAAQTKGAPAKAAHAHAHGHAPAHAADRVVYEPPRLPGVDALPGYGQHVVLVAGDEEYRSEEALPMLARILAVRHGFRCTVLFSKDPESGTIDPGARGHIPGLAALGDADLLVLFTRFRRLPDADMAHIVDYVERGQPLIGIRTATHAFDYEPGSTSPYAHWTWNGDAWKGGFGRQVLGETWVAHYGKHGEESTRGVIPEAAAGHPVLRGVGEVWGPTDVYALRELPPDATVLLEGVVLAGMAPGDAPVTDGRNEPRMPIAWLRERAVAGSAAGATDARTQRVVCSTIGAAVDFADADLRRLFVNACYWAVGLEGRIPERADVDTVGNYRPSMYGFGKHQRGMRPGDHALPAAAR
jgi:hypothetical protein